jgi:hypothetical protein
MRKQRAIAGLTEAEIEQIARWLQHGKYQDVRVRIAKPRPEGSGLNSTPPGLWKRSTGKQPPWTKSTPGFRPVRKSPSLK